jgi:hypothetical protein
MRSAKILSLLLFSIVYSINLNAMSDEEFFAGKKLKEQIKQYCETNEQEVLKLKASINSNTPTELFALDLMLEKDIKQGKLDNLKTLINTAELFVDFLNENQLKQLMYWLLYCASYHNQGICVNYIYQKYLNLFEISIFSGQEEYNDSLIHLLAQENKFNSILNLIDKGILDWVQDKSDLKELAEKNGLKEMETALAKQIKFDEKLERSIKCREKFCYLTFAFTLGLSGLLLFSHIFS